MKRLGLALSLCVAWAAPLGAQGPAGACAPATAQAAAAVAPASRIEGDWRVGPRVELATSAPPVKRVGTDLGIAPPETRLDNMILLLKPAASQRQALDAALEQMQLRGSCTYHQWMSAAQFADAYSNSASDVNAIASWLRSEGFAVAPLPAGRGWIEFSGTAGQVERAFGTAVNETATSAGSRYLVQSAIRVPASLAPLVDGLASLDGAVSAAAIVNPRATAGSAARLGAGTVADSLGLSAVEGTDGTGEQIAIAARSSVRGEDAKAFRDAAGLPSKALSAAPIGTDPGVTSDQGAVTAMASWAGVAAPGAQILVVPAATTAATDGIDRALAAIVDGRMANTVVVGYSACESELSAAHQAFYSALYRQAAAEGISVIAASGDSGASACHAAGSDAAVASGFSANALASTAWDTAVGAAADGANGTLQAWASAPGMPTFASGGGASAAHALPGWQPAVPGTRPGRLLPDVALPTGADSTGAAALSFCMGSASAQSCAGVQAGGSAIAAALFAGIVARLDEQYGPQGNLAPRLYALRSEPGVFQDVETGSAKLACVAGSPGCDASGRIGYDAVAGYDLATGLGSVHADKLIADWARPDAIGTGAVTVNVTVSPTAANSTYNLSAQLTFTATVASQTGGGTPTGSVQFFNQATNANLGGPVTVGTNGISTLQVSSGLAQGGNNVVAQYSGDATYEALVSPAVTVNMQPSTTTVTVTPSTTTPTVGQSFTATAAVTVGTPAAGASAPTGKVTLSVDGAATSSQTVATANGATTAAFTLTLTSGGTHALQATYVGDTNYVTSTSQTVQIAVAKGTTTTTLTAAPTTLASGTPETLTATVAPATAGGATTANLTGTVSFYDGTTLLGTQPVAANVATLGNITLKTTLAHQVTAVYSGDNNWLTSTSTPVSLVAVLLSDTVALTATPANPSPGQLVTLAATVTPSAAPTANTEQNPTGTVTFYQGLTALGSAPLTASLSNTAVASLTTGKLSGGQDAITAVYSGDTFYGPSTSNALTINVQDFSLTPSPSNPPTNLNIVKGQAGSASFVVTALGGFGQQVQVVCTAPGQADMTCTPSPQQVTPTSTVTFTVQTYATGGPAYSRNEGPGWPRPAGGVALASVLLLVLPRRGRQLLRERGRSFLVLALLLAGLCGAGMGCQSVTTPASAAGTPLGVSTLTITATAYENNVVVSHSAYLSVNVIPAS